MRLVCIGVPKHMDDRTFVQEISEELNLELDNSKIKKTFRIQAKNIPAGKTLPLNIEFYHTSDRSNILSQVTTDKIANLPPQLQISRCQIFPRQILQTQEKIQRAKTRNGCQIFPTFQICKDLPVLKMDN